MHEPYENISSLGVNAIVNQVRNSLLKAVPDLPEGVDQPGGIRWGFVISGYVQLFLRPPDFPRGLPLSSFASSAHGQLFLALSLAI